MYLIYMGLVLLAMECTGQPTFDCRSPEEKCICNPVVNVAGQSCNFDGLADIQAMLIAQQVQIARLQNDSDTSEISRLSHLLAEQKNITDILKERVAQLEERIRDTASMETTSSLITESQPTDSSGTCPVGYQRFQRTCYRFSTDQKPYSEARAICHGDGGHLATVKNNETHDFLTNHVRATTRDHTWIGLSDQVTEGLWVWDDGTSLVGDGIWGTGEPNGSTGENCAQIYPGHHNYRWNDSTCPSSYYYICEVLA
ncbi:C-type lectin domain family 10 member A-like isoform X2 [Branchiostoma floridae]|uniref:C-type lectin domain family 10 member A-like isoform X2 n=1 Tax=Branchiostoma floridae TaxID=7739 RepID=A0A9J7M316_BRAFL|nr:C-type lectin domain family 10 member A-like isoform X2 [Branchiostoma floridae]